jgi:hypothetical protein
MSDFKLGEHDRAIHQLSADMVVVKEAVLRIELTLAERRGERKVGFWVAGMAGTVAAALVTLLVKLVGAMVTR